jgi:hypothetical protein
LFPEPGAAPSATQTDNPTIANECAALDEKAIRLVELIDKKRSVEIATSPTSDGRDSFVHEYFFLSVKFRFHGSKTFESASASRLFAVALKGAPGIKIKTP